MKENSIGFLCFAPRQGEKLMKKLFLFYFVYLLCYSLYHDAVVTLFFLLTFFFRIKENFVLDTHSSVQVKFVVDGIKAAFHNDITYKQSHKLVFSVFPGTTSRVANPVRLEVRGSYYSYRGIASQSKQAQLVEVRTKTSRQNIFRRIMSSWKPNIWAEIIQS